MTITQLIFGFGPQVGSLVYWFAIELYTAMIAAGIALPFAVVLSLANLIWFF